MYFQKFQVKRTKKFEQIFKRIIKNKIQNQIEIEKRNYKIYNL